MSFNAWLLALEDAWGSWLRIGILILVCILTLVFDILMIKILVLYLEGEKSIMYFKSSFGGFGGCWRFLGHVWYLDLDLDMFNCLLYTHDPNVVSLSWFWRCKDHLCPVSPVMGALEDAGGSWLGFGIFIIIWIWSMGFDVPMYPILALYFDLEGAKDIHVL